MKKVILAIGILFFIASNVSAQLWTNLQNLEVAFKIKNAGINVDGKFKDVSATVSVDEKHFENSTFQGVIQAKSVNTENTLRDSHLRDKAEFFNVAKYPTITMKAVKVGSNQVGGSYKVDWLVTMKGITKKITTDVLVNPNGNSLYILTVFQLNRRDWKVGDKGILMSDNVVITVSGNLFAISMLHHLTHSAVYNLSQLLDVMKRTSNDQYVAALPVLFGSSIGMHVRHIVEFYQCMLSCEHGSVIQYDARERNPQIESDIAFAGKVILTCIEKLQRLSADKELVLLTSQNMSGRSIQIPTSILRELSYLIEHSIHHMAILKIAYSENFPSIDMPPQFGVAYSTIKHQQLVHSNVSSSQ